MNYLPVILYKCPRGKTKIIECVNILAEDRDYFLRNDIRVSMEELRDGVIAVYGCPESDESEESEQIVLSNGRSCEDTMQELAQLCKQEFGDKDD